MRVLGIETTGLWGSLALAENGKVLFSATHSEENRHAEEILHLLERGLAELGFAKTSLDRIAVSRGPGSFTGIRVGLATALGLSMGLNCELVGVDSMRALAAHAALNADERLSAIQLGDHEVLVALRDARRDEVFCAAYDRELRPVLEAQALSRAGLEASLAELLHGRSARVIGDALPAWPRPLGQGRADHERLMRAEEVSAATVALLGGWEDARSVEASPYYVRGPMLTKPKLPVSPLSGPRL